MNFSKHFDIGMSRNANINITFIPFTACITDIRLNNKWFPMINSENGLSDAATLDLEQGVENDCVREDCFNVTCPIGNPISMICYPLWGLHECRYVCRITRLHALA